MQLSLTTKSYYPCNAHQMYKIHKRLDIKSTSKILNLKYDTLRTTIEKRGRHVCLIDQKTQKKKTLSTLDQSEQKTSFSLNNHINKRILKMNPG